MSNFFWYHFWQNWLTFGASAATQQVNASEQLIEPITPANLGSTVNSQSGATYTLGAADRGKLLIVTNATPTVTLTDPTTFARSNTFQAYVRAPTGTTATLSPAGGRTINGGATFTLTGPSGIVLFSDGTNWFTVP